MSQEDADNFFQRYASTVYRGKPKPKYTPKQCRFTITPKSAPVDYSLKMEELAKAMAIRNGKGPLYEQIKLEEEQIIRDEQEVMANAPF